MSGSGDQEGDASGWRGEIALLSVCVAPFAFLLPLLNSIPSKLRVKYVGIARAHDFLTPG